MELKRSSFSSLESYQLWRLGRPHLGSSLALWRPKVPPSQGPMSVARAACLPLWEAGWPHCSQGCTQLSGWDSLMRGGSPAAGLGGGMGCSPPCEDPLVARGCPQLSKGEGDWGPIQGAGDFPRAPPRQRPRGQVQGQMVGSEHSLSGS